MKRILIPLIVLAFTGCVSRSVWVRGSIEGRVLDANTNKPIEKAEIRINQDETVYWSDASGRFKIPEKKDQIRVFALGASDTVHRTILHVSASDYPSVTVQLPLSRVISGERPPFPRELPDIRIQK